MTEKLRVGVLISGSGTNMQAIVTACIKGFIDAKVVFVGSDNPEAKGLIWAEKEGIPIFVVDYKEIIRKCNEDDFEIPPDFDLGEIEEKQKLLDTKNWNRFGNFMRTRAIAEAELLKEMSKYHFDLLVLAGFMRKLTPYFIDRVNMDSEKPRIMNIHPALLPAFPGKNGYEDTLNYGCKVGGCTVHFIDYGEDTGPIIEQRSFNITPNMNLDDVKKRGLSLEYQLYPQCIQLFARDRLKVVENGEGRKVVVITEAHK